MVPVYIQERLSSPPADINGSFADLSQQLFHFVAYNRAPGWGGSPEPPEGDWVNCPYLNSSHVG
jgi:hypothetical protein